MQDAKCKRCRREGEKLFLKGERCYSQKCAVVRKPYPPGIHGQKKRGRREKSEFSRQLHEKQKMRFSYGISESQFSSYVENALSSHTGDVVKKLTESLEMRLDNVVFRLGFAMSRSIASQMVSHGHILVNGKKVFTPSYQTRVGSIISIAPTSRSKGMFPNLEITLKKHQTPSWISLVPEKYEGTITSLPKVEDMVRLYDVKSIIEYYSR